MPFFDGTVEPALALLAAFAAGVANAVAGGGSALSFPVLVWIGLPAVEANATNAVGLWTGSVGGAASYRKRLGILDRRWLWLFVPALAGGGIGAWLLLGLPPGWFEAVAPYMVIGASLLVAVEPLLRRHLRDPSSTSAAGRVATVTGLFAVAVYGGYFGAGVGILLLVTLSLLGLGDLHEANALKNLLVVGLKGVAVAWFVAVGALVWPYAVLMIVGSTVGGWTGGHLIQKVPPPVFRRVVVAVGVGMGIVMVLRS